MKKSIVLLLGILLVASITVSAVGITVPNNFDFPRVTIEGAWLPMSSFAIGSNDSVNGSNTNLLLGATLGMGNGFAWQCRAVTLNVPSYTAQNGEKMSAQGVVGELNLLYKIDNYVAVYLGATYTEGKLNNVTKSNNTALGSFGGQIGGMLDVPVYRQLSGFLDYSIGNQISQFSIGAEYEFSGLGTINAGYYILQQYSIEYQGSSVGYTMKGPLIGLSFEL